MNKFIILFFGLMLIGCNQNGSQSGISEFQNENDLDSFSNPENLIQIMPRIEKVTIKGDYVRVRDKPDVKNSEVKFQLMKGDQCDLVERGPADNLDGIKDFWYKIDCSGRIGWVWGYLTSLNYDAQYNLDKNLDDNSENNGEKWSEDEESYTVDINLCAKLQKSLTDFYLRCPKLPNCKITKAPLENAFDGDQTAIIFTAQYKKSVLKFVEDENWPFEAVILNEEIILSQGIKVGLSVAELEKIVGKTIQTRIFRIQGENDQFYLWIENGKVSKIEYEGYTG